MIKKLLFLSTVLIFTLGLQSVKAQNCNDISVTETPANNPLSPVSIENISYVFSNSNSNISYTNFQITINLPLGITYNSFTPSAGIAYVSNTSTSVTFNYTSSLSVSNPITINIFTQPPCSPTIPPITTVTLTNDVGGNLPSPVCTPIIATSLTLTTPTLAVTNYWNGTPLLNIVLNLNTGDIGDLCYELTNSSSLGTIPQIFAAFTPDPSTQLLGYLVTGSATPPVIYNPVPSSPATISTPLSPHQNTFVHFQYKVINAATAPYCPAPGGFYTFSYGLNAPPSTQCQSIPVDTYIQAEAGVPNMAETATVEPNSIFCSNVGSNTMPLNFVFTNNGAPIGGYEPGNAKATHLQIMVSASNDMGTVDVNSFAINGVLIPSFIITPNYIDPNLLLAPVNAALLDLTRYNYYFIDLTKLPDTWAGAAPFGPNTLSDIDGDGYVDDLSDIGGSNTFTLTATFTYNSSPPAEFAVCGADKEVAAGGTTAWYLDQCLSRPNSSCSGAQGAASYHYSSQAGLSSLNLPIDVTGDFPITVCPGYEQSWAPPTGPMNEITFPASPPYSFDFLCPNGYHNIHVDMPYGFTLNTSSLTGVIGHPNEFYLPPITATPPVGMGGTPYSIIPVVTVNNEVCNTSPPSLDINLGRLPLARDYSSLSWVTYSIPCLNLPMHMNCNDACVSSLNGYEPFSYTFQYVCGGTGCSSWADNIACANNQTFAHCPGPCGTPTPFQTNQPFTFLRTNLGYFNSDSYNSCTNQPTPADIVTNTSVINTSAAYPGDQVEAITNGQFSGNPSGYTSMFMEISYDQFRAGTCGDANSYAFDMDISQNSTVTISNGSIPALGSSGPVTYTLTPVIDFINIGGSGNNPVGMCFLLPAALMSALTTDNNNENLNFVFDDHLVAKTTPFLLGYPSFFLPGKNELKNLRADFRGVSPNLLPPNTPPNDTLSSCDTWGALFDILQPNIYFEEQDVEGSQSCGTYTYSFAFTCLDALEPYSQKDFPNEFRPYAQMGSNFTVAIPPGWKYVSSEFYIEQATNISSPSQNNGYLGSSVAGKTYEITPTVGPWSPSGQTVTFNGLDSINCWPLSDLYSYGVYPNYGILFTVQPFCNLEAYNNPTPPNGPPTVESFTVTGVDYTQAIQQTDHTLAPIYQQTTNLAPQVEQVLVHEEPILQVTPQSSVDVKTNTFTYDISICETGGFPAPYTWLTVQDPSNYFTITSATLNSIPVPISVLGPDQMIEVGNISARTCYTLQITATVNPSVCTSFVGNNPITYNSLTVTVGNECTGFPVTPPEPTCQIGSPQSISFTIFPATLNLLVNQYPTNPVDLCDGILTYNFNIEDPYGGTVGNPVFWMTLPNGVTLNQATFTYPITTGTTDTYSTDVVGIEGAGTQGWALGSLVPPFTPDLANGLPGFDINNLNNNQVGVSIKLNTSCTYTPGQSIGFYVGGNNTCNLPLSIPPFLDTPPINGTISPDNLNVTFNVGNPTISCGPNLVTVYVQNTGLIPNSNNDLLMVSIPPGFTPSNPNPAATVNSNSVVWNIAAGSLPGGNIYTYTFDITPAGAACGSYVINANLNYTYTVGCTTGPPCNVVNTFSTSIFNITSNCGNITLANSETNVPCYGGNTGSATVTASGGASPYNYSWSDANSQTTANATGLSADTYSITVTDANGCLATASVTITQPAALTATIGASTNVSCSGGNNGSATVSGGGGTSPYFYSWSDANSQTTAAASGLSAGTYTITVTDANSCTATASVTITQPVIPLTASISGQMNEVCNGGNTGTATVAAGGGTSPYIYFWAPSGGNNATATGLLAGTYTVTITDANSCITTASVTITQPPALTVSISSQTNVGCIGGNTGSATVMAGGGTSPYTYSWAPSGGNNATATGLSAGTYTVTITDANGCITSTTVTITGSVSTVTANISSLTNVSCNGGNNGSATVTAGGGTSPYTYSWAPSGGNNNIASSLTVGTYTVTVTDAHGCTATAVATITQPASLSASILTQTNVSCNGNCNGTATVSDHGGTPAYVYSWNTLPVQTNQSATGLCPGSYIVTITDANGCTATASVSITQPAPLTMSVTTTNILCNGQCNATATTNVSGGSPAYYYSWSNCNTCISPTMSGLCAGTYTVIVGDQHKCHDTVVFTITQPPVLTANTVVTNSLCGGFSTARANPIGGTPGYHYVWSPSGQTSQMATGLTAGTYTVTVTDANGCSATAGATVIPSSAPSITISAHNADCNENDGTASVSIVGGMAPYVYTWTPNVSSSSSASNLAPGTYTVMVTDAHGCTATASVTITQPAELVSSIPTQYVCPSHCVTISGGTSQAGVTYHWLPPVGLTPPNAITTTACPTVTTTYTLTAREGTCVSTVTAEVIVNPVPIVFLPSNLVLCNGTGSVNLGVTALSNATFSWNPSAGVSPSFGFIPGGRSYVQAETFTSTGTYTVTVTYIGGCSTTASITVTNDMLSASVTTSPACGNTYTGSATASPVGPYTYLWTPSGGNNHVANHLYPGTYTVTITDVNGCTATASGFVGNNCRNNHGKENGDSDNDTLATKQVKVYPNPANSLLNVEVQLQPNQTAIICMYNSLGEEVRCENLQNTLTTISTMELASGIYYYRIIDVGGNLINADKVMIVH